METTIIFLDIDGVLNKSSQWKKMFTLDNTCIDIFCKYLQSLKAKNLRIILTSTWKNGWDNTGNHAPHIADLQSRLNKYGLKISGKTSTDSTGDRAKEINDFISSHKLTKCHCIVVDDDPAIFKSKLLPNCKTIFVNANVGFSVKVKEKKWYNFLGL